MEPHAQTPPPPVLSPEVTATQALEASVSVRTRFRHRICGGISINTTTKHYTKILQ